MTGITQFFLGIIIVGLIMSVKVILDGFTAVGILNERITALRTAIEDSKAQLLIQEKENLEGEESLQKGKEAVEELAKKEKNMIDEINALRIDLDGDKSET